VQKGTLRYRARRDPQDALRQRLRELAAVRVRFGYRRLTVLLRREGWRVNAKRIYRLYDLEGLAVRTKPRRKLASRARVPLPTASRPNERWSMDFVSARLADGRWFRTLTVVDCYTRESLALVADRSLTGVKVAAALSHVLQHRPRPIAITVDNGGEFVSRAMDAWAYAHDIRLDFIRPGKPVENAFIESFNGRLRDECLNSHVFATVAEAQAVLDTWRHDYNHVRPHSALGDATPAAWRRARDQADSIGERPASREPAGGHRAPTLDPGRPPMPASRYAGASIEAHERSLREEGERREALNQREKPETEVGSVTFRL
jgi:putative transposase